MKKTEKLLELIRKVVREEVRSVIQEELGSKKKLTKEAIKHGMNLNDIVNAPESGVISGYGTDVIENEFDDIKTSPIIKSMNAGENIIVTPHVGGMTIEGQTKAYKWAINKL